MVRIFVCGALILCCGCWANINYAFEAMEDAANFVSVIDQEISRTTTNAVLRSVTVKNRASQLSVSGLQFSVFALSSGHKVFGFNISETIMPGETKTFTLNLNFAGPSDLAPENESKLNENDLAWAQRRWPSYIVVPPVGVGRFLLRTHRGL